MFPKALPTLKLDESEIFYSPLQTDGSSIHLSKNDHNTYYCNILPELRIDNSRPNQRGLYRLQIY